MHEMHHRIFSENPVVQTRDRKHLQVDRHVGEGRLACPSARAIRSEGQASSPRNLSSFNCSSHGASAGQLDMTIRLSAGVGASDPSSGGSAKYITGSPNNGSSGGATVWRFGAAIWAHRMRHHAATVPPLRSGPLASGPFQPGRLRVGSGSESS